MALRSFTAAPPNKWILQALATGQAKEYYFKLVLFFDINKEALRNKVAARLQSKEGPQGTLGFYFYKATFILRLYNAYEYLLFLGDYVFLLCNHDVEGFLRNLYYYSTEELPARLAGCLIFGAFANLWPPASSALDVGEGFINVRTGQVFISLYDITWLHSQGKGKSFFYLYRLLLKIQHFYSCFFFLWGFWPSFFNSLLVGAPSEKL